MATLRPCIPIYALLASLLLHITSTTSYILLYPLPLTTNTNINTTATIQDHCYSPHQTIPSGEPTKLDCHNAITAILASPNARSPQYWTGIPLGIIEHWTSGTCHVDFQPTTKESEDVFSLKDVADMAAVIVGKCVQEEGETLGGLWRVGEKGVFRVSVQFNYVSVVR